ncbi:MAG: hypothetical protein IPO83_09955 [Chitinophagaceae bacterium]|nr:hypothetical protein [Chitinophagaceae bacterium]
MISILTFSGQWITGKTWMLITTGLNENVYTRCVREDPNRKNLLYAGTETSVYVSFDNGDHWQSLQIKFTCYTGA